MMKRKGLVVECCLILAVSCIFVHAEAEGVAKKMERWPVVSTRNGEISAVRVSDGINASYLIHFITLRPSSVLLPVVLNADMLFYVRAGSGKLRWSKDEQLKNVDVMRGDVHRLLRGSVFYVWTQMLQGGLQIDAIFENSNNDMREPETEPYYSIQEMVTGFDERILQATFQVPRGVIDELLLGQKPPLITNAVGLCDEVEMNKGKEDENGRIRLFNVFEERREMDNRHGWSSVVTGKQATALEGSEIGISLVNLTTGSMLAPHWNTMDTEILVVLEGMGVVKVISKGRTELRFEVEEGDVVAVPRLQPMAQMSFNNGSFVFMGITRTAKKTNPKFFVGKSSVLQILDKPVLQLAFNVPLETLQQLLAQRKGSTGISPCISCAEQQTPMEQQMEKEKQRKKEEAEWRQIQEEMEKQRQIQEEMEKLRQKEKEETERRQTQEEMEKQRQMQEEMEKQRQIQEEMEKQRQEEMEKQRQIQEELEKQKQKEDEEAERRQIEEQEKEAERRQEEEQEAEWRRGGGGRRIKNKGVATH